MAHQHYSHGGYPCTPHPSSCRNSCSNGWYWFVWFMRTNSLILKTTDTLRQWVCPTNNMPTIEAKHIPLPSLSVFQGLRHMHEMHDILSKNPTMCEKDDHGGTRPPTH